MLTHLFDRFAFALQAMQRKRYEYPKPFGLAVLGIMKNESMNVEEWIAHYLWQGADTVFLIDNGSTDGTLARIEPWIAKGKVRLIQLEEPWKQKQHYWTAIQKFQITKDYEWLLIADLDEFWFCKDGRTLSETVKNYDDEVDVVYANWSIFGSSGYVEHPKSLRRELVFKQPELSPHKVRKWLCRTRVLRIIENIKIHTIAGVCSSRTVSDNHCFQINHYVTQSVAFFTKVKMTRGDVVDKRADNVRTMEYFTSYDAPCTTEDRRLSDQVIRAEQDARLATPSAAAAA